MEICMQNPFQYAFTVGVRVPRSNEAVEVLESVTPYE